ncbi:anthranilate synthase component II [Halanaerobium salsuginis]|uniref:Anthranilate synthase, component II n=1 Tax=Halanaerobium salsuginis TaxID=29563 RepID=A0A1I4M638_9FIRM|nr:aminodeoxychorismate/anthranilate synthase component II [Halanaerobium salsuginis]SFL98616.1 anthranilate synthase, component II [Halanaerobium salsuginis]
MILVIDNYDSFTYNLVHLLAEFAEVKVYRNDCLTLSDIELMSPEKIVISPGPGTPSEAGISLALIKKFQDSIPILGVCLGHQCLAQAFGSKIVRAAKVVHGKVSLIKKLPGSEEIFAGLGTEFQATRYHSLLVEKASLSEKLQILAESEQGEIMALKHCDYPLYGVQFHPESILTKAGPQIIENFLNITAGSSCKE